MKKQVIRIVGEEACLPDTPMGKVCRKCTLEKLLCDFYRHPSDKHGVSGICKSCQKSYNRQRTIETAKARALLPKTKRKPESWGAYRHGHKTQTRQSATHKSWSAMLNRCRNPNSPDYPNYGGRGISICQKWVDSFSAFLADMGERPDGMSLDRFPNNNGNYEPGNCRWATASQQARNRRPRARREK